MGDEGWGGLVGLLHDPSFMRLMRDAPGLCETYEEFARRPMPCDVPAGVAWEFVSFLRRVRGNPDPDAAGQPALEVFWTQPEDVALAIDDAVRRASRGSSLWKGIARHAARKPIRARLASDLAAALRRDGVEVEDERLRDLVVRRDDPRDPGERAVANLLRMLDETLLRGEDRVEGADRIEKGGAADRAHRYHDGYLNYADIEHMRAILSEGGGDIQARTRRFAESAAGRDVVDQPKENLRTSFARMLDHRGAWGASPLLDCVMASEYLLENHPFESLNSLLEIAVRHRMFYDAGVPALAYVPFSKLRLDWELGALADGLEVAPYGRAMVMTTFGIDCTQALRQFARFWRHGLDRLEEDVRRLDDENDALCDAVRRNHLLNHRQVDLLCDMVQRRDAVIDVREYEQRYHAAPSTASTDLAKLVELNMLQRRYQGKKQVFWLREDIVEVVRQRDGSFVS